MHQQLIDHDAEVSVIGSALQSGEPENLSVVAFFSERNRIIWQAINVLHAEDKPVNIETVATELKGKDFGGYSYLTKLLNSVSTTLNAPIMAERLRDLASRRSFLRMMEGSAKRTIEMESMDEVIADLASGMTGISSGKLSTHRIDLNIVVDEFLERYADPVDVWGLRTGIKGFDFEFGGLQQNEVFRIAGDPGVGKSILASQLGFQLAGMTFWANQMVGHHAGVMYHLEMSEEAILRRGICAKAQLDYKKVRTGRVTEEEQKKFMATAERFDKLPIFISDMTGWTTAMIKMDVARLIKQQDIKWVLVDYGDLLNDQGSSDLERQGLISKGLHEIAKMGLAVVVVETLNKEGMKGLRGPASVYGTIKKAYDADVIAFFEKKGDGNDRVLRFTKAREADANLKIPLYLHGPERRIDRSRSD